MKGVLIIGFFFLYFISVVTPVKAQECQWMWVKGDTAVGAPAIYGTLGVPSPTIQPGFRYSASHWVDAMGNFWLYGGGCGSGGSGSSDLWKYDPVTNFWTWMKGPAVPAQPPIYNTQGLADPTTNPGGIGCHGISFKGVTPDNKLWLFAGNELFFGSSDLWSYDITTNNWTWEKGPGSPGGVPGVFGIKGIAAGANNPPTYIQESKAGWIGQDDTTLWMFGGFGSWNTMWQYNITTKMWRWMNGDNLSNRTGKYGIRGVPAINNVPGSRSSWTTWRGNDARFWIFGGSGYDAGTFNSLRNDLWVFDPSINQWGWMGKDSLINSLAKHRGCFGKKNISSPCNWPGSRWEASATWVDIDGNLWLFGGLGNGGNGYGDMWKYDVTKNLWILMGGDTAHGGAISAIGAGFGYGNYNWGTQGVASSSVRPPRTGGDASWTDKDGNFWLYIQGRGTLMKFDSPHLCPVYQPPKPTAAFTSSVTEGCVPLTVAFVNQSVTNFEVCSNVLIYLWDFGDPASGANNTSTSKDPVHQYNSPGTYSISLQATSLCNGADSILKSGYITVVSIPLAPITNSIAACFGQTVTLSAAGSNIKWYNDDGLTTAVGTGNPFNSTLTAVGTYTYYVTQTISSCQGPAAPVIVTIHALPATPVASNDISICLGDAVTSFTSTGTTVKWYSDPALITPIEIGNPFTSGETAVGTYTYYATQTNTVTGCESLADSVVLTIIALPVANAGNDTTICPGTSAVLKVTGSGTSFEWNTGENTSSVSVSPTITAIYTVTVSDGTCINYDAITVIVAILPIANAGNNISILEGEKVQLNATGGNNYSWTPPNGLSCTNCPNPLASPTVTTTYIVTVEDSYGCSSTDTITISIEKCQIEFVPNAFSPNGDGENDVFKIYGNCIKKIELLIFDRWGTKVFQTEDIEGGWDGNYNDKPMYSAVFVYYSKIVLINGKEIIKKGNVLLIR